MNNIMKDLLLVQSFNLSSLIEEYRLFFLSLLPSVFILAVVIEYLDRLEPFTLVKRAFISILILTTVTSVYEKSIMASMNTADEVLKGQKQNNILLMDLFDGFKHWDKLNKDKGKEFYKDKNALWGTLAFLKYHLFDSFVNDGFTVTIYFITKICFLILKVVYSLVYYLGYGLIGIPCLIYLFPSMGNVLRGAILSYLWCLVIPHVLVFIISMIGTEINKGYVSGQIIGGSMIGTAFLFILTLFVAFSPLIGAMILNGSGISQAGGIIASIGANYVMNLPKNTVNNAALVATGGTLGPKMKIASATVGSSYKFAKRAKNVFPGSNGINNKNPKDNHGNSDSTHANHKRSNGYTHNKGSSHSYNSNDIKGQNNSSSSYSTFPKANSVNTRSKQAYKSNNQKQNGGTRYGAVSKHGGIHRKNQNASSVYRTGRRSNSSSYPRNRNNAKSTRRG
ncbi:MAG: hypothetical protein CMJ16_08855 [Peredibacter sp.]|nr:hypothetical protein [Peredibacter sp.]